jgi:hypothetical protein
MAAYTKFQTELKTQSQKLTRLQTELHATKEQLNTSVAHHGKIL